MPLEMGVRKELGHQLGQPSGTRGGVPEGWFNGRRGVESKMLGSKPELSVRSRGVLGVRVVLRVHTSLVTAIWELTPSRS